MNGEKHSDHSLQQWHEAATVVSYADQELDKALVKAPAQFLAGQLG